MLFDTHAHLNLEPLVDRVEELFTLMEQRSIWVNIVGVDYETSLSAVKLAEARKMVYASVGIHPNNVAELGERWPEEFAKIASLLEKGSASKVVCVGETGLDFSRGNAGRTAQTECFSAHVDLAIKHDLPLNIHCRDAHDEMIALLEKKRPPAIIHCFSVGEHYAARYVALGCFLSIPGIVTFKNAVDLHKAVIATPLEFLLVETDAPYLAPAPFRGKVNDPTMLHFTVEKIAALKGLSYEKTREVLFKNALRALKLPADGTGYPYI